MVILMRRSILALSLLAISLLPPAPVRGQEAPQRIYFTLENWSLDTSRLERLKVRTEQGCLDVVQGSALLKGRFAGGEQSWTIDLASPSRPAAFGLSLLESAAWKESKFRLFVALELGEKGRVEVLQVLPLRDHATILQVCVDYLKADFAGTDKDPGICGPETKGGETPADLLRKSTQAAESAWRAWAPAPGRP